VVRILLNIRPRGVARVVSPEISGGIFPEISRKIGLLFLNLSAEKFRTFLAANLIKNHKKYQVFELSLCRKKLTTSH